MTTRTRSGMTMAYDDTGTGRPLVLLHAFPLFREMWRSQIDALASECRVITPDLRGFGGTGQFDGPPSVERMADDVAELLDALKVTEPIVLGGLSMGGYVALAFARRHANRMRALILADTKAEPDDDAGKANRDKLIAFAKEHTAAEVADLQIPKVLGPTTLKERPAVVAEVRRIMSAQTPEGIIAALQALRDRPDAGPGLAAIKVPTLVIVGSKDAVTPPSAAESLAKRIAGAKLETIAEAGHLANLERPDAFTELVRSFLRSIAG